MIKYFLNEKYKHWEPFVSNIQEYFQNHGKIITAKRNVIKVLEYQGEKVVVKSFKVPNFINQFAYRFIRASKAKRSFLNAQKLQKLGAHTPAPIAYYEVFTPFLKQSYYICEYFDYDFEIRDVLASEKFDDKEAILDAFVNFSFHLHEKGVYHIDYSPGNVLVKKEQGGYTFSIVDVNRMKFATFTEALRFQNLSRFSATKEDTRYIAKAYAKVSGIEEAFAIGQLFFYHDIHQKYLKNKKKIKSLRT